MPIDPAFAASAGAISLALSATLWAIAQRRGAAERIAELTGEVQALKLHADVAQASAEAFDTAVIVLEPSGARLASGAESLAACAVALGLAPQAAAAEVVDALRASDPDHARKIEVLTAKGEPCDFEARGAGAMGAPAAGMVVVEGRTAGALAWLRVSTEAGASLPSAARFAAFLDHLPHPGWMTTDGGRLLWANRNWLNGAGVASVDDAVVKGASFDRAFEAVVAQAAAARKRREAVHWAPVDGRRRAFLVTAEPLEGGGVGALALDITEREEARDELKAQGEAHGQTLDRLGDAVAIFSAQRRLAFHNTAFAELWGLEPAWLADAPTHPEVLDRLRQRRRLPETVDYAAWKARELEAYERLGETPDEPWSLPDGRTLRVVRQPDASGGLLLIFSDLTDELKLRAQYNALVQVQQATLDKLNDAVAVFGSDGRLRLHNDAFERFWGASQQAVKDAGDFDGVVELCLPLVHDRLFWAELKARVADPDPQSRAPISGEIRTSDRRVVSFQTRPLPDGATLIAFDDITATRELEQAVAERSAALAEAERLKREFVGNVSYELRTPLTTIIGYSELLDRQGAALPERSRAHVASVRAAASQLARSIDDVLDMAQIDAGEMALSVADVGVPDLLGEAARRHARAAADADVRLTVAAPASAGVIRADAKRLGQALDHLIGNALRSTPPGGEVTLAAKRAFSEVQLTVSDTGRGIPFHVQAHIFDRFVGRDRGGPGLGLALVKALVELHGGWVALESEPGQGAAFTCHLPETAYEGAVEQRELAYG